MRYIFSFLLWPLIYFYGIELYGLIKSIDIHNSNQIAYFIALIGSVIIFSFVFRQDSYYAILKHELVHNFFAILTFRKPQAIAINKQVGGAFYHKGKRSFLIILSPYFFPIVSYFALLIYLFNIRNQLYFFIFLGVVSGFDLATLFKDVHRGQSDLKVYNFVFTATIVILFFLLFWGGLFGFVVGEWQGMLDYSQSLPKT